MIQEYIIFKRKEIPRGNTLKTKKKQILYEYHNSPIGGHQEVTRTLNKIRMLRDWHGITKDVEEYISKCEYCQRNKLSKKIRMPLIIAEPQRNVLSI